MADTKEGFASYLTLLWLFLVVLVYYIIKIYAYPKNFPWHSVRFLCFLCFEILCVVFFRILLNFLNVVCFNISLLLLFTWVDAYCSHGWFVLNISQFISQFLCFSFQFVVLFCSVCSAVSVTILCRRSERLGHDYHHVNMSMSSFISSSLSLHNFSLSFIFILFFLFFQFSSFKNVQSVLYSCHNLRKLLHVHARRICSSRCF